MLEVKSGSYNKQLIWEASSNRIPEALRLIAEHSERYEQSIESIRTGLCPAYENLEITVEFR